MQPIRPVRRPLEECLHGRLSIRTCPGPSIRARKRFPVAGLSTGMIWPPVPSASARPSSLRTAAPLRTSTFTVSPRATRGGSSSQSARIAAPRGNRPARQFSRSPRRRNRRNAPSPARPRQHPAGRRKLRSGRCGGRSPSGHHAPYRDPHLYLGPDGKAEVAGIDHVASPVILVQPGQGKFDPPSGTGQRLKSRSLDGGLGKAAAHGGQKAAGLGRRHRPRDAYFARRLGVEMQTERDAAQFRSRETPDHSRRGRQRHRGIRRGNSPRPERRGPGRAAECGRSRRRRPRRRPAKVQSAGSSREVIDLLVHLVGGLHHLGIGFVARAAPRSG